MPDNESKINLSFNFSSKGLDEIYSQMKKLQEHYDDVLEDIARSGKSSDYKALKLSKTYISDLIDTMETVEAKSKSLSKRYSEFINIIGDDLDYEDLLEFNRRLEALYETFDEGRDRFSSFVRSISKESGDVKASIVDNLFPAIDTVFSNASKKYNELNSNMLDLSMSIKSSSREMSKEASKLANDFGKVSLDNTVKAVDTLNYRGGISGVKGKEILNDVLAYRADKEAKDNYKKYQNESYKKEIDSVTRYIRSLEDMSRLVKNVTSQDKLYTEDLSTAFDGLEGKIKEAEAALNSLNSDKLSSKLRSTIANAKYSLESAKSSIEGKTILYGSSVDANNIRRYTEARKQAWNTIGKYASSITQTSWNIFKKTGKTTVSAVGVMFKGLGTTITGIWNLFGKRGKSTTSMLKNELHSLLGYFSIYQLINLGKESTNLASDMVEVRNVIHGVFGDASDDIEDFAKTTISSFGLTELQTSKMIGVFGGMLEASNIVGDAQSVMSKNLTALSGDLASFYNMPVDDVFTKLKSGLAGETEPLRAFGLNMTVANLEAYALSKGIDQSWQSMSQATQQTLRYNYILENLAVAQGDFSRTSSTWANQIRLLSNNWAQLLSILGGATIKVLYPAVQVLNQMVSLAIQAAKSLADIFGFDYESLEGQFGVGADMSDALSASPSLDVDTSDIDNYSDAMTNAADSTKDFSKETESAGDNLQSFDKLNNITTQDMSDYSDELGDTSGTTTDLGNLGGSLLDPISYIENVKSPAEYVNKWLEEWIDLFENKEWYKAGQKLAKLMDKGLKEVYDVISDEETLDKAEDLGEGIADFFNGIIDETDLFLDAGKTFGAGVNLFTKFYNSFFDTLNWSQLGRDFTTGIKGFVSEVDGYEVGRALTQLFAAGIDFLGGAIEDKETWLALGDTVGDGINGAIDNIDLAKTIPTLTGLAGRLFQTAGAAFETVDWTGLSDDITTGIDTAIDNVDPEEFGTTLGNMVMDILTVFDGVLSADWGEAGTKFGSAINSFVDTGATKKFASTAVKFIGKIIELLSSAAEEVDWSDFAESIWNGITEGFDKLDPDSQNIMKTILTFLGVTGGVGAIGTVVTKLGGIAGGITDIAGALKLLFGVSSGAGAATSSVGGLVGVLEKLGSFAIKNPKIAGTLALSGVFYETLRKPGLEDMDEAKKNVENLAKSAEGATDKVKELRSSVAEAAAEELPFKASGWLDATTKLKEVSSFYDSLSDNMRRFIALEGETKNLAGYEFATSFVSTDDLKETANEFKGILEEIGDINASLELGKLIKNATNQEGKKALAEYLNEEITIYSEYLGALNTVTDEEGQKINDNLQRRMVSFENATGEFTQVAGDTIVGVYQDAKEGVDYLITATGLAYDTAKNIYKTATDEMIKSAVSSVDGISKVFTEDGRVLDSARQMAYEAGNATISGFGEIPINLSNAISQTALEMINKTPELTNATKTALNTSVSESSDTARQGGANLAGTVASGVTENSGAISNALNTSITNAASASDSAADSAGKTIAEKIGYSIEDYFIGSPLSLYANIDLDTSKLELHEYSLPSKVDTIVPHSRSSFGTAVGNSIESGASAYSTMSTYARTLAGDVGFSSVPGLYSSNADNVSYYRSALQAASYPNYSFESVKPANISFNAKMSDKIDSMTIDKLNALIMKLSNMKDNSGDNVPNLDISIGNKQIDDYIVNVVRRNGYKLSR